MAYVPFSNRLMNEVDRKISKLRGQETQSLPDTNELLGEALTPAVKARILDDLWAGHEDLRTDKEFYRDGTVRVTVRCGELTEKYFYSELYAPLHKIYSDNSSYKQIIEVDLDVTDDRSFDAVFDAIEAHAQCKARWGKVTADVTKYMKSCKSLNEALKLWPDFAKYVSAEDIAKVNEKTEKAKAKDSAAIDVLKSMDLDNIQLATVIARMSQGQNSNP